MPTATSGESPELVDLFTTYTASADSIGRQLGEAAARSRAADPLLVATATDLALYPGDGAPPSVLGFRMGTQGFKELAGVSHLGPALATLVALRTQEPDGTWRAETERLLAQIHRARTANSADLWSTVIAVRAYQGREADIAHMIDYALSVSAEYLERALADPGYLSWETLRSDYLADGGRLPVSFDRIMIATFYLVGMDISHRLITWLDEHRIDWRRTMVLIVGKQGRPTAGVTWRANSVAGMVLAASRKQLPLDHLYIAPHAPAFAMPSSGDLSEVTAMEPIFRSLWAGTRAVMELGGNMFDGFPAYQPDAGGAVEITEDTTAIGDMPLIKDAQDWFAMVTRLRMVMEDPRQLLSGAVSDFAAQELVAADNNPRMLFIPGLDGEPYLRGARS